MLADPFAELVFAGPPLDRAAHLRSEPDVVARLLDDPTTLVLDVGRSAVAATRDGQGARLRLRTPATEDADRESVLLGVVDGAPVVAALSTKGDLLPLRDLGDLLDPTEASLAVTAVALDAWHSAHPRCSLCGEPTEMALAGWLRRCPADGSDHYPRTNPAVIMAVVDADDRLLLARGAGWPEGRMSILAGFVEPGETLAAAVAREVLEEVGVEVTDVQYQADQPWPFPASLMLGFTARAVGTELTPDETEIAEARWFTRDELTRAYEDGTLRRPTALSISARLVEQWYGATLSVPSDTMPR